MISINAFAYHSSGATGVIVALQAFDDDETIHENGKHLTKLSLLHFVVLNSENPRFPDIRLHEILVMRTRERRSQRPHALDPFQLDGRLLIDADTVAHDAERSVFHRATARHYLPLSPSLPLHIDHTQVHNRTQVRMGLQHVHERPVAVLAVVLAALCQQPNQLRIPKAAAHKNDVAVEVSDRGRTARRAEGFQIKRQHILPPRVTTRARLGLEGDNQAKQSAVRVAEKEPSGNEVGVAGEVMYKGVWGGKGKMYDAVLGGNGGRRCRERSIDGK